MQEISTSQLGFIEGKKETAETQRLDVAGLAASTNAIIKRYEDKVKNLPQQFQDQMRNSIVDYFRTSVDRYDKDKERGLDVSEFDRYRRDMLNKVEEIMKRYAESEDAIHAQEQQKAEAARSVSKIEDLDIASTDFNPDNLKPKTDQQGKLTGDVTGVNTELGKFNKSSEQLRAEAQVISSNIAEFKEKYRKFEENKTHVSVLWRGFSWNDEKTEGMRKLLDDLRRIAAQKKKQLDEKQKAIDSYGDELNETGDDLKSKLSEQRNSELGELDKKDQSASAKQRKNEQQYKILEERKQALEEQRTEIERQRQTMQERGEKTAKSHEELQGKRRETENTTMNIQTAIGTIEDALAQNIPDPQRKALEAQLQELRSHQDRLYQSIIIIDRDETSTSRTMGAIEEAHAQLASHDTTLTTTLTETINPSLTAIETSMRQLEISKMKNGTLREQTEARYMEVLDQIDSVDAAVADNVLDNTLANEQTFAALKGNIDFINNLHIERPNPWDATAGLLFTKLGNGIGGGLTLISHSLDKLSNAIKKIPIIGVAGYGIDVISGALEGTGELCKGVGQLIAHPIEGGKGLLSLVGFNFHEGELWSVSNMGTAWANLGKSLIASENFSRGEYGKGAGKVLLNVLLTATGAGAAAKGAQAATIAFRIARAGSAGMMRATAKAAFTGARVFGREVATGLSHIPKEFLGVPAKIIETAISWGKRGFRSVKGDLPAMMAETGRESAKVIQQMDNMTIGGMKVLDHPTFAGKTADDLSKLSPQALAEAGVTDTRTIGEFLRYRDTLRHFERLRQQLIELNMRAISNEPVLARVTQTLRIPTSTVARVIRDHVGQTILTTGVLGATALRRIAQTVIKQLEHMGESSLRTIREVAERAHKAEGASGEHHGAESPLTDANHKTEEKQRPVKHSSRTHPGEREPRV